MQEEKELTKQIIEAIQDKKGLGICVIDLSEVEGASTGKFIICQGKSTSQVGAIADNVEEHVWRECRRKPYASDGYRNCQWIVIDYGEVMVHVFLPETRQFYNIEELWSDAPCENIADID